jgi:hypothetical protein
MAERAQKSLYQGSKDNISGSLHSFEEARPPASRSPAMHLSAFPSPTASHRHSFSEQFVGMPASPRSSRQFSLSSASVQDLMNNPPKAGSADPAFEGRDWHHITVGELVNPADVRFVEVDTGIEDATNVSFRFAIVFTESYSKP